MGSVREEVWSAYTQNEGGAHAEQGSLHSPTRAGGTWPDDLPPSPDGTTTCLPRVRHCDEQAHGSPIYTGPRPDGTRDEQLQFQKGSMRSTHAHGSSG